MLLTAFAAVIGRLAATSLAAETGSTASEASTAATSELSSNETDLPFWGMGSYQLESFS
jgi:hypothetical protein